MQFEWDTHKNQANKSKHGIDFETATRLWDDPCRIEIQTSFTEEDRVILIGKIDKKLWSAIFTSRDAACRIISVRRARKKETTLYDKSKNS
jgi:uncharacterized DUF497 family protein